MPHNHSVLPFPAIKDVTAKKGVMFFGNCDVSMAAKQFDTPLYIYNSDIIRNNFQRVRKYLPQFKIAYSLKANPTIGVVRLLRQLGALAEVASWGECCIARKAGYSFSEMVFAGPAKKGEDLERCLKAKIGIINAESPRELDLINNSRNGTPKTTVCIRVNTLGFSDSAREKMVGGASRFGIDEEAIPEIVSLCERKTKISGIHVYTGSGILDELEISANFKRSLSLLNSFNFAGKINTLVFGGGFGVPNAIGKRELNLRNLGSKMEHILSGENFAKRPTLILELGRYLVANAGIFVTKIIDRKQSRGATFLSTDGGINNFLRPVFMRENHPVFAVNHIGDKLAIEADIGGPLCTPIDVYAKNASLPEVGEGDLIALMNAGAYGYTMSFQDFLGHVSPAEILVDGDKVEILRRRGRVSDLWSHQM